MEIKIPWLNVRIKVRWLFAGALLLVAAALLLVSNITPHLQSCETINRTADIPEPLLGQGEQSTLRLPVSVCEPISPWTVVPIGALALLLLLPDYPEIGFGGVRLKRLQQIADKVEEEAKSIHESVTVATGIHKDHKTGILKKGDIRNVELRVDTIREILLGVLQSSVENPSERLYKVGLEWGKSWSVDFARIEGGADISTVEHTREVLDDWSYYDSTAGLGRILFGYDNEGRPVEAQVLNGFLGVNQDEFDLRQLFAGYLAGSLSGILASQNIQFKVSLKATSFGRDIYQLEAHSLETASYPAQ
jgi:hypothetical protein